MAPIEDAFASVKDPIARASLVLHEDLIRHNHGRPPTPERRAEWLRFLGEGSRAFDAWRATAAGKTTVCGHPEGAYYEPPAGSAPAGMKVFVGRGNPFADPLRGLGPA